MPLISAALNEKSKENLNENVPLFSFFPCKRTLIHQRLGNSHFCSLLVTAYPHVHRAYSMV